ncbi:urokinase-type plasminogen activator-like, partial [Planococcus citri]|uniref:urokinase-type plasminogen activator-like n=1 Tax=Planococcus citri TaxID=170843 RepID=UPI0031F77C8C
FPYFTGIQKRGSGFPKFTFRTLSDESSSCTQCGSRTIQHQPLKVGPDRATSKIVGGSSAPYGAYPWQVEIQAQQGSSWEHHCGGAIIGEDVILTAAHCLQQHSSGDLRVIVGKHTLSEQDKYQNVYEVAQTIVHPEFRKEGPHSNDIALLKIHHSNSSHSGGFTCNSHVQSICLPEMNIRSKDVGDWCTVSGWGTGMHGSSSISQVLQAASVPLLDLTTCRQSEVYGSATIQFILDSMICAGTLEGGVDACGGDSGGPLACKINGRFVLLGVVSWGDGCARKNKPGVYTRVSYFLPWIEKSLSSMRS